MARPQSVDFELHASVLQAFEAAWADAQSVLGRVPIDAHSLRSFLVRHIERAVADGERDPDRLKAIALPGFEA